MQILYRSCCGLDVHAKTVVACLIKDGKKQTRTFSTMTDDLLALSDWLTASGCTHVAVESTGVYWKPIFNLLEGVLEVVLVNARHVKAVPGRKTDVLGVSGRLILRALADGETDATKLAEFARGRLRRKGAELRRSLEGRLTKSQRFVLSELLHRLDEVTAAILRVNEQIEREVDECRDPFVAEAVRPLQSIPGVGPRAAEAIVSEVGVDMSRFPTDSHLASWAGMCPGSNESAGKRLSGKTNKGSTYLRNALIQSAWAASHTKQTYLAAQFRRLVRTKGKKRALVAAGHSILVIAYHMMKRRAGYEELGGDYFDRQSTEHLQRRLIRRLERLGLKVVVEAVAEAA
jgi:transposase